jgi:hypothetical protein
MVAIYFGCVLKLAPLYLYGIQPVYGSRGAIDIELGLLQISKIPCNPHLIRMRITGDKY